MVRTVGTRSQKGEPSLWVDTRESLFKEHARLGISLSRAQREFEAQGMVLAKAQRQENAEFVVGRLREQTSFPNTLKAKLGKVNWEQPWRAQSIRCLEPGLESHTQSCVLKRHLGRMLEGGLRGWETGGPAKENQGPL